MGELFRPTQDDYHKHEISKIQRDLRAFVKATQAIRVKPIKFPTFEIPAFTTPLMPPNLVAFIPAKETTMQYDSKDTKDELKKDLKEVLEQINEQMDVIKEEAIASEQSPMQMKDADGRWVFVDLIVAKTDALHSLVKLEDS